MKKLLAFVLVIVLAFAGLGFALSSTNSAGEPVNLVSAGNATVLEIWIDGWANTAVAGTWSVINTDTAAKCFTWAQTDVGVLKTGTYYPNIMNTAVLMPVCVYRASWTWNKTYGLYGSTGICVDSKGNTPIISVTYKAGQ